MAGVHPGAQKRQIVQFIQDSGLGHGDAPALEFLTTSPKEDLAVSGDSVQRAFLMRVAEVTETMMVPTQYLDHGKTVLGHAFTRKPTETRMERNFNTLDTKRSMSFDSSGRFRLALARFAFHLPSAKLVIADEMSDGTFFIHEYTLDEMGLSKVRGAFVRKSGELKAMGAQRICGFCTRHGIPGTARQRCLCPPSFKQRMEGRPLSLSAWSQLMQIGRRQFFPSARCIVSGIKGYPPAIERDMEAIFSLDFNVDSTFRDVRALYLNHICTETLRIDQNPSLPSDRDFAPLETLANVSVRENGERRVQTPKQSLTQEAKAGVAYSPGKAHLCVECGLSFAKASNRTRHMMGAHRREKKHRCTICGCQFAQIGNLKRHINQVHHRKNRFSCSLCPSILSTKANLDRHLATMHGVGNLIKMLSVE